jgi:hypothetical protein
VQFERRTECIANIYRRAKPLEQNTNREKGCSGPGRTVRVFVLVIGLCSFSFQLGDLPAHLRDLLLQGLVGQKQRTEEVQSAFLQARRSTARLSIEEAGPRAALWN